MMQQETTQGFLVKLRKASIDSRRFRLWAAAVFLIVLVLSVEALWPDWSPLPGFIHGAGPWTTLLILLAALLCEYIDSSMGMGYGTTLTPLLLLAGFDPLKIVPAVLLSEFVTGISAGLLHHRDGNIDLRRDKKARQTALLLSVLSFAGVMVAVTLAVRISKFWLTASIATIILVMGVIITATVRRQLSKSHHRSGNHRSIQQGFKRRRIRPSHHWRAGRIRHSAEKSRCHHLINRGRDLLYRPYRLHCRPGQPGLVAGRALDAGSAPLGPDGHAHGQETPGNLYARVRGRGNIASGTFHVCEAFFLIRRP
jgi:hypothetical protein